MQTTWHTRSHAIQERYFSTGKGTYLWVSGGSREVSWAFTFLDFGMSHTLAGCSTVDRHLVIPDGVTSHKSFDVFFVDGDMENPLDEDAALRAVFDGHHAQYVAELYHGLGVSLTFSGIPTRTKSSKL